MCGGERDPHLCVWLGARKLPDVVQRVLRQPSVRHTEKERDRGSGRERERERERNRDKDTATETETETETGTQPYLRHLQRLEHLLLVLAVRQLVPTPSDRLEQRGDLARTGVPTRRQLGPQIELVRLRHRQRERKRETERQRQAELVSGVRGNGWAARGAHRRLHSAGVLFVKPCGGGALQP